MPLRVGFDLDGTVADMYDALHREAVELFGEEALRKAADKFRSGLPSPKRQAPLKPRLRQGRSKTRLVKHPQNRTTMRRRTSAMQELHLTARQQMQLWDHVKKIENFWLTLPELEPGIIARIAKTARERRWEVIFLTTRPSTAGDLVQLQSQRWLEAHGFQYPECVRGPAFARQDRRCTSARRVCRRPSRELPRHRRRVEGQGDPDLARAI